MNGYKEVCKKIASLGADAISVIPKLLTIVERQTDASVRIEAVKAIREIRPNHDQVSPKLMKSLRDIPSSKGDVELARFREELIQTLLLAGDRSIENLTELAKTSNDSVLITALANYAGTEPKTYADLDWYFSLYIGPDKSLRSIVAAMFVKRATSDISIVYRLLKHTEFRTIDGPQDGPHFDDAIRLKTIETLAVIDWKKLDPSTRNKIIYRLESISQTERNAKHRVLAKEILQKNKK